jgi:membrane associated rhomboid family serine protease
MWMLWVFGDNVEDRLGRFVYPFFYVVGGLLAILTHWAIDPMSTQPVIGASGAVAAVLGAYAITFPGAKVRTLIFIGLPLLFDLPALIVLGAWFLLQTFMGMQGLGAPADVEASVAFWAHIGGFIAGVVLMPLLTIGANPPDKDWRTESREMFKF